MDNPDSLLINTPELNGNSKEKKADEPSFIIAIGASAGGMEEINTFFDHTPLDGVAYVIVQHLSSDFKSRMVELLSKHSKLKVKEAEEGMTVESNEVYLIPNNKYMTIEGSRLRLTGKEEIHGPHLTVNRFFNSLAVDYGTKAIGIVLSGLGSDGTEGVKAIKKAGGMVIARNPETSEFGSMPTNAIDTGVVDFVLEPELMPDAIEDFVKHGGELLADNKNDEKNTLAIIGLINDQSPLDFSEYKQTTILRRIKRRAAYNNFTRLGKYVEFLKTSPQEVEALTQDFLISVTSFFRDKEAFSFVETTVLPEILNKLHPGEELKMWVAGCATGEEAYSMAILAAEQLTGTLKATTVKIFATDIDVPALTFAGKGVYTPEAVKDLSAERLEKYFTRDGKNYRVKQDIRKMVIFARHDLAKSPPYCNMHMITCRNLLIYMNPGLQKKIFLMLLFGLKVEGYLFLGSSENPSAIIQNLEVVNKKWKIYKNLETNRVVRFDAFSLPQLVTSNKEGLTAADEAVQNTNSSLAEAVNATFAEEHGFLAVCIDDANHVVKTYGDTSRYLLQKNFTSNLEDLLPRALAVAFNTLSIKVLSTNEKETLSGIKIKEGTLTTRVTLSITPLALKRGEQKLLLVTFKNDSSALQIDGNEKSFDEKFHFDQYTLNLEEELKRLKEKLHSSYEKLDASNENMQSFNEELLSANEEMQSTNEEMQSVNEELHTINTDYQLKNKELLELNDDLNNYFKSNLNGQLFVNKDMLLMKYSAGTVKHINLNETDIGRPITHITTNLKLDTLVDDLKKVIAEGITITKEIEATNGSWYQIMTMPYVREGSGNTDGAIISFRDITELKNTQLELKVLLEKREEFMGIASHELRTPLTTLSGIIQIMEMMTTEKEQAAQYPPLLHRAGKQIKKLVDLISELLDVSKTDSGHLQLKLRSFSLKNILEEGVQMVGTLGNSRVATIKGKTDILMYGDESRLGQVINNLLTNAVKYSTDGEIIIETKESETHVDICVTDKGEGIPPEKIPLLFGRFYRADKENRDKSGLGLGLYIANEIVRLHKGEIKVNSEVGKGSTFCVSIRR